MSEHRFARTARYFRAEVNLVLVALAGALLVWIGVEYVTVAHKVRAYERRALTCEDVLDAFLTRNPWARQ